MAREPNLREAGMWAIAAVFFRLSERIRRPMLVLVLGQNLNEVCPAYVRQHVVQHERDRRHSAQALRKTDPEFQTPGQDDSSACESGVQLPDGLRNGARRRRAASESLLAVVLLVQAKQCEQNLGGIPERLAVAPEDLFPVRLGEFPGWNANEKVLEGAPALVDQEKRCVRHISQ
jgi:hypothetical protein